MPPTHVTSDGQVVTSVSGSKNYHLVLSTPSGGYATWFVPAGQSLDSLDAWNSLPGDVLSNLGTAVLFVGNIFTVSGGVFTYHSALEGPAGITLQGTANPPTLTAAEGGYAASIAYYQFAGHTYDGSALGGTGQFIIPEEEGGGGGGGGGGDGGDPSSYFTELGSILYELGQERDLGLSGSSSVDNFRVHRGWFVPEITKKLLLAAYNALTGLTVALGADDGRDELARQAHSSYYNLASPIPGRSGVLSEPDFRSLFLGILHQVVADLGTIGADESVISSISDMVSKLEEGKTSTSPVINGEVQRTVLSDRNFREQVVSILSSWLSAISP